MFKDDTVFVIGAGASAEFKLPVGWELMNTIQKNATFTLDEFGRLTNGCADIFNYYDRSFGRELVDNVAAFNRVLEASRQLSKGIDTADSVDEYIFRYADDPLIAQVGKLQIAYAISNAERKSILSYEGGFGTRFEQADDTWIWPFAKALINGVKARDVHTIGANITIICFNYDRCIEHYLEHALVKGFHGLNQEEAREIVSNIRIIHPYGTLGGLAEVPFGSTDKFWKMADNIVTWSETIRDPEATPSIRRAIIRGKAIIFMGFAFAKQNMDLMRLDADQMTYQDGNRLISLENKEVLATAYKFKKQVHRKISENVISMWAKRRTESQESRIYIEDETVECRDFIRTHLLNLVE